MSDTQSLTSNSSAGTAANATFLELEDIGKLGLGEIPANNPIKRLVIGKYLNKKSFGKTYIFRMRTLLIFILVEFCVHLRLT